MSSEGNSLGTADCVVFGVLTALGYLVGLYFSFSRRLRVQVLASAAASSNVAGSEEQEAFLGGRSLPASALAVSVLASAVNGMSLVGFVGHYYAHGFNVVWTLPSAPLMAAFVAVAFVPLLYGMKVTSVFQYLRLRFDNKVSTSACVIYFVLSLTLGALGIYSAAIGISTMLPVPLPYSIVAIGLAGTIYTALGGLRSVVWADCVQALVMLASPLTIIGKVAYDSQGAIPPLRPLSDFNVTDNILRTTFDLTSDENVWSSLLAAVPLMLVRTGLDQMAVQRFMAAKSLAQAKRIAIAGGILVVLFFFLVAVAAVFVIYWYRDCDPLLSGAIKSYDQIVPYYIRESLSNVATLRGLFLAGLLGASTSTLSSIVNTHAAVVYVDVVSPCVQMSQRRAIVVMRLLAFGSGTIMTAIAFVVPHIGSIARGAAWAGLLVCVLQLWHAVGRSLSAVAHHSEIYRTLERCPLPTNSTGSAVTPSLEAILLHDSRADVLPFYRLSYFWSSTFGALLTLGLGTILSFATGGYKNTERNIRFTSPFFLKMWARLGLLSENFKIERQDGTDEPNITPQKHGREEYTALRTTDPSSLKRHEEHQLTNNYAAENAVATGATL
ncbi:putative sodium-dependent multivitamin transporter isoform X2 [Haemaphysalis longicornis]